MSQDPSTSATPALQSPPPPSFWRRRTPVTAAGALAAVGAGAVVLLGNTATVTAPAPLAETPTRLVHLVTEPDPSVPPAPKPQRPGRDPFEPLIAEPRAGAAAPQAEPAAAPSSGPAPAAAPARPAAPVQGPGTDLVPAPPASAPRSAAPARVVLVSADLTGDAHKAVFTVGGARVEVPVGGSFGPAGQLLLLSVQQGPASSQWTAVLQRGHGEPFDLVSGESTVVR